MQTSILEDQYQDVLQKAVRGMNLNPIELARPTGVQAERLISLFNGEWDEAAGRVVARALGLRETSLVAIAEARWQPLPPPSLKGFKSFIVAYGDETVNSYLVWDSQTREAALFDSGPDASEALSVLDTYSLRLSTLFLTHTHADHVEDYRRVMRLTGCTVRVHAAETMEHTVPFRCPSTFMIGSLEVQARHTWGHSPGGTSYVVRGLERDLVVAGDAIFAGSIGRPFNSYHAALETLRSHILSLPDATLIYPGHGHPTTVGEERVNNPFLAI